MRQSEQETRKIVWAIDISEAGSAPQRKAADIIGYFQNAWPDAVVQPVHVLGPADLNLSTEFTGPWLGPYAPSVEHALSRLIEDLGLKGIQKPEIITQVSASTARAVEVLAEYASRQGAELIVAGSHGRKGVSRFLLGSFTETLLLRSRVPVLVAGPHQGSSLDFGRVLFPTDFAEGSKEVLRHVVGVAKSVGAHMTLHHAIERLAMPVYPTGVYSLGAPWIPFPDDVESEKSSRRRRLESWARWATHEGVPSETAIDDDVTRVAEQILERARQTRAGWIAMASHSGRIASALLGSVTRQVVRGAECPVWVVRLTDEMAHRRVA